MAKKEKQPRKKRGRISSRTITAVATLFVTLLIVVAVAMTTLYVRSTIAGITDVNYRISEEEEDKIETIDLEALEELQKRIEEKNRLDEPRAGRLRNPFSMPDPSEPPDRYYEEYEEAESDEADEPVEPEPLEENEEVEEEE